MSDLSFARPVPVGHDVSQRSYDNSRSVWESAAEVPRTSSAPVGTDNGKRTESLRRAMRRDRNRCDRHAVLGFCCSRRLESEHALTPSGRHLAGGIGLFPKPPAFLPLLHVHAQPQIQSPEERSGAVNSSPGAAPSPCSDTGLRVSSPPVHTHDRLCRGVPERAGRFSPGLR